jgi:toxin ParE1/3/4
MTNVAGAARTERGESIRATITRPVRAEGPPESMHDLISLRAHIAEHDPAAAKRVALHVIYCVEHLLSENPQLAGRVPGTRELVIPKTPYIVPYRIRGTTIEIARVYHSSRRWPERL